MALDLKPSRFAVLPDDVPDVVGKKGQGAVGATGATNKKKKKAADAKAAAAALAKKSTAKKPTLKSMAFGGASGKKKSANPPAPPPPVVVPPPEAVASTSNGTSGGGAQSSQIPPGKTSAQWADWQKRDSELVSGTYESELEAALIQSKMDFQNEMVKRQTETTKPKNKKKAVPIPLNEFSVKLLEQPAQRVTNGNGLGDGNYVDENDEELLERFRTEARLELEREKHLAEQRELISSRQTEGVYKHPNSRNRTSDPKADEKTQLIESLRSENDKLRNEVDLHKDRLKKLYDIFQEAQELKDKAKLLHQMQTMSKLNEDLNEEIRELHSQLEQERSKSHAALNECRKLMEQSRRRTNTETSS